MAVIVPGILTNDEEDYVARLRKAELVSNLIQIDVIDGQFAPNVTIDPEVIKRNPSSSMLEVQLIVKKPKAYIEKLASLDFVTRIIFPFESNERVEKNIFLIKSSKKQAGLSINPETPVSNVLNLMRDIDLLCIFSATPGFSGKKLEQPVFARIKEAKKLNPSLPIEIDIGVNFETAHKLASAGANFLIATSALHNASNYGLAYKKLAKLARVADN